MRELTAKLRWFFTLTRTFMVGLCIKYMIIGLAKFFVGQSVHSPLIAGDGIHNATDAIASVIVILVTIFGKEEADDDHKFGHAQLHAIAGLGVALILFGTGFQMIYKSVLGIVDTLPNSLFDGVCIFKSYFPTPEKLIVDPKNFWLVFGLIGISAICSLLLGPVQIAIGKKAKEGIVEDDGKETVCDGIVEIITCAGIFGEYILGVHWIEYPLCFLVGLYIAHEGEETLEKNWDELMLKTAGLELENMIAQTALNMHGVIAVPEVMTFRSGEKIHCNVKVTTAIRIEVHDPFKDALNATVSKYFKEHDLGTFEYRIRFTLPKSKFDGRAVFPAVINGEVGYISNVTNATHFLVCDYVLGRIERCTEHPLPCSDLSAKESWPLVLDFLRSKHACGFCSFKEDWLFVDFLEQNKIEYTPCSTFDFFTNDIE